MHIHTYICFVSMGMSMCSMCGMYIRTYVHETCVIMCATSCIHVTSAPIATRSCT